MSRRLRQYRQFRRETVAETAQEIMYAHRYTKGVGRRYDSMMDIAENKYTFASLPIDQFKAQRIAQALHKSKR